jgi:hypothetical protein
MTSSRCTRTLLLSREDGKSDSFRRFFRGEVYVQKRASTRRKGVRRADIEDVVRQGAYGSVDDWT